MRGGVGERGRYSSVQPRTYQDLDLGTSPGLVRRTKPAARVHERGAEGSMKALREEQEQQMTRLSGRPSAIQNW